MLGGLKLGREEYCQRLLTMLIVAGPYPRWNTPSSVSPKGRHFLKVLDELSFGASTLSGDFQFVDEFDMPRRHDEERGCAPDYAVLSDERLWLIELKTEKSSHRRDQIRSYFEFAHHYHPQRTVDITYLTPPMRVSITPPDASSRFAHIEWGAVAEIVQQVWGDSPEPAEGALTYALLDSLSRLTSEKLGEWRARLLSLQPETPQTEDLPAPAPVPLGDETSAVVSKPATTGIPEEGVEEALSLAERTAEDKQQRGVDAVASSLEELQEWRLAVRNSLAATDEGSPLRHVMPWLWQESTTGEPLTEGGRQVGYELRLSWYKSALYS